jgi:predicted secreted protein
MKNMVLLLAACMFMHCGVSRRSITYVTLNHKEDSLSVKSSASFAVEIPLQSGTGYSWEFDSLSVQSKLVSRTTANTASTEENMPGGTIMEVFTFKAPSGFREETLTFTLRRPWEKNNAPAEVRMLKLKRL